MLSFHEYQVAIEIAVNANSWRRGQAAFNVLDQLRPDLSAEIRGTALDPYYLEVIPLDFLVWVDKSLSA